MGCIKIFKSLHLNKCNIVIHESNLPNGKGWSPLTWQILEGKNEIPITLFEAVEEMDSGDIYLKDIIKFEGHELCNEIKDKQGKKTNELILKFVEKYNNIKGEPQIGTSTYHERRRPENSELDINKTISEQFNLLRVCDNNKYPAFFIINKQKYIIKIKKQHKNIL